MSKKTSGTLSPFEERRRYLRLENNEMQFHDDLMTTPMNEWPESLYEYVVKKTNKYGLCGEIVSASVAEWIRWPRDIKED